IMSVHQSAGDYGSNNLECRFGPSQDSCPGFMTCGGGGTSGICGCTPQSNYPTDACGVYSDGCGGYVDFGGCPSGQICGGDRICHTEASYQAIGCGPLQSNRFYKFTGASIPGTCFSISGSNIVLDGDGKTLTANWAFELLDGASNIVIKNFVIDANIGVAVNNNYERPSDCTGLPQDIRIQGNRFLRGGIGMGTSTSAACRLSIEGNRIDTGSIDLGHYAYQSGVGGYVLADNVIETPYTGVPGAVGDVFSLWNLWDVLVLNNAVKGIAGIGGVQRVAVLDNRFHVTAPIPAQDTNGKSMLKLAGFWRSRFAGNYVHNQISQPQTDFQFAMNTYGTLMSEFDWNTIIQQVPDQYPGSGQIGINFRSGGNDNFLYKNYIRVDGGGGRGIELLDASSPCVVDVDTGQKSDDCLPHRFVVDSNIIISTTIGVYHWGDGGNHLLRNNVIVGPAPVVIGYACEQPSTYVHNVLDNNGAETIFGECGLTLSNNIRYTSSMSGWFRNRAAQDYHLVSGSGAIDQVSADPLALLDADGIPRPAGARADLGAYEFINDSQAPAAPTNPAAVPMSWSRLQLSWNPASDNDAISAYKIYRYSSSSGTFEFLKKVPSIQMTDFGLDRDTVYRYKVSAVDRSGNESPLSAEVSARTFSGFADPPQSTPTPTPTAATTRTPTPTPAPTTASGTPANSLASGGAVVGVSDGACGIVDPGFSGGGWFLLTFVLLALGRRRLPRAA
ncbi:MAG: fibronectin type III domain-containing protein, partial [Pseudomonadota bacterium]